MVDPDKPFSNGLMYPSDPSGAPSEVYNCRCTMRAVIEKARRSLETSKLTFKQYIESKMKDGLIVLGKKAKDDPERYNNVVSNIRKLGFTPKTSLRNIDVELLDNSIQQITHLEKKYNVLSKCKNIVMSGKNDEEKPNARAFVDYKDSGIDGWWLHLCEKAFSKPKNRYVKFVGKLVEKGEYMPCLKANYIDYEVTHEFGHIIENMYLQTQYYDKGYEGTLDELYILVKNEIIEIARLDNPNLIVEKCLSDYGASSPEDFFAECFANSQLGKPNVLGNAMLKWLKEKKI